MSWKLRRTRASAGEPTQDELGRWRKLAKAALAQAKSPLGFAGELGKAANAVRHAIIPSAYRSREGCFYRLMILGQRFAGYDRDKRCAEAFELTALAEQVLKVVGPGRAASAPLGAAAQSDHVRERRSRADVDG